MFWTFLGPTTHLFDDLQYCKSSNITISDPIHLFDDVILEWSLANMLEHQIRLLEDMEFNAGVQAPNK